MDARSKRIYIVWNKARNEGFATTDEQDAASAQTGNFGSICSTLAEEFHNLYDGDNIAIEIIDQ